MGGGAQGMLFPFKFCFDLGFFSPMTRERKSCRLRS